MQYGLTKTERSEVWARFYKNRWVHWTGQLVKVSAAAMLFRQLGATSSYDVLVRVPHIAPSTRTSLLPGRVYNYVGRLDSYDDLFRTIYLEQGQVFDAGPEGVPGVLQTALPLARRFPPPPRIFAGPPGVGIGNPVVPVVIRLGQNLGMGLAFPRAVIHLIQPWIPHDRNVAAVERQFGRFQRAAQSRTEDRVEVQIANLACAGFRASPSSPQPPYSWRLGFPGAPLRLSDTRQWGCAHRGHSRLR